MKTELGNTNKEITKEAILAALQEKWDKTNGRGFLSDDEEMERKVVVAGIEAFLVELGLISKEDLKGLSTWGWRSNTDQIHIEI